MPVIRLKRQRGSLLILCYDPYYKTGENLKIQLRALRSENNKIRKDQIAKI